LRPVSIPQIKHVLKWRDFDNGFPWYKITGLPVAPFNAIDKVIGSATHSTPTRERDFDKRLSGLNGSSDDSPPFRFLLVVVI